MPPDFILFVLIGFAAQLVDGALGMAYGTLSTSILLAMGYPPVTVSASVHSAQFFTAGLSGASHTLMKNIDWKLCAALSIAGAGGGIIGATFLTRVDAGFIKPWIYGYLLCLGIFILVRFFRRNVTHKAKVSSRPLLFAPILGFIGGTLDAIGGGWGPMVTTNLLARGHDAPRYVIGSVNAAEFFVKTAIAATFFATVGMNVHGVVAGLLVGGVIAAPLGAYILRVIKPEILMGGVGMLIILLSVYQLGAFFLK